MALPLPIADTTPFHCLEYLGEGGLGRVYLAEDATGERVALKILHPALDANKAVAARLMYDAFAVSAIDHANVARVRETGALADGASYIASDYVPGRDLSAAIAEAEALDWADVINLGRQACAGLAAAHGLGLLHLDLKPNNVRLAPGACYESVKLMDFGLGAAPPHTRAPAELALGALGTPEYWSPEQATAQPLDARSDIYSLGVILFEALTGTPPFTSHSYSDIVAKHLYLVPTRVTPPAHRRRIPVGLQDLVLRCLAKAPEDRFESAAELAAALAVVLAAPNATAAEEPAAGRAMAAIGAVAIHPVAAGHAARPAPDPRATEADAPRRRRLAAVLAGGAALAACAAVAVLWLARGPGDWSLRPAAAALPAAAPAPAMVAITVRSEPPGAFIFRSDGGATLGETPVELTLPQGTEPVEFVLRFPDGQRMLKRLVPDQSVEILIRAPARGPEARP